MAWSQSPTLFIQFKCFSAVGVGTVIKHLWRASSGVMCECFSAVGEGTVIEHLWRAASGVMGTSLHVNVWVWSFVSGDMRGGFGPSSLLILVFDEHRAS